MTNQLDTATRNARLDAFETAVGVSPTLEIRTGAQPANCAAGDAGSLLATLVLPADFMNNASGGTKTLNGTWQVNATAPGTAAHYRIKSGGGTCRMQGSVSITGGGGDLVLDNTNIATGQQITITAFTLTEGNP